MRWTTHFEPHTEDVPFRTRLGAAGTEPMVVGLHGYGESEAVMAVRLEPLADAGLDLVVVRGPHAAEIRGRTRIRIGYSWYQYDGNQDRFVASMGRTARWLFRVLDRVRCGRRVTLVGFSQGAYLAYYVALRYPSRFAGVVGIGGRAKDESLVRWLPAARGVRVLHLHGRDDPLVSADACRESIEALARAGLDATFREVPGAHEVSSDMVKEIRSWV